LLRRTACVRSPRPRAGIGAGSWRRVWGFGRVLGLGAWAAGSLALSSACGSSPSESPPPEGARSSGQLELGLSAQLAGVTYRLSAVFDVTGAESLVLDTSDDPEAAVLTRDLPAGGYVVALRPDFVVSRADGAVFEPVEARLLSDAVQSVQITANESSRVTIRFAVPGGDVSFGSGTLEIGFEVSTGGADCRPPEGPAPVLELVEIAGGLDQPVFVVAAPGDDSRLFVLEKGGRIRVLVDGVLAPEPFADLSAQIASEGERGLLGLAFHPNYAENGLSYVHFSSNGTGGVALGSGVIAELSTDPFDRDRADVGTLRRLLTIAKPEANHNGGMLAFGPDGFLYAGVGDGGGGNDQHGLIGNGQALDTLLGKMLRIDVDGRSVAGAYAIPPGNLAEVSGRAALPEIWAYGLRNPWRFSFDPCNGDLFIGDVGQNTLEEIDWLPLGTPAGTNFGWRIMEGSGCRPGEGVCDRTGLTLPVDSYSRDVGASVTGGYVYRGSAIAGLRGSYLYADFVSGRAFRFRIDAGAGSIIDRQDISLQLRPSVGEFDGIASFGQDNAGELYVAAFTPGAIYRVVAGP
jgi:glucose/arabinose dehydrogenase